jgi:glycosyltransferase involved in cell wall biosynthesis
MSFSRYNTDDSVISAETVVRPMWTGDAYTLSTFFTASGYTEYYLDVYQTGSAVSGSEVQFDIQYGNINGSGSAPINSTVVGYSPSRIVYGQYRNLVYGTETTNFSFDGGTTTAKDIYAINISRTRYKQSIQPGTFNLTLTSGSATIKITDDRIRVLKFVNNEKQLINIYDSANILILPSYTEAHPKVIDESLSRMRAVIVFNDIKYVIQKRYGVFSIKRNVSQLARIINYIQRNNQLVFKQLKKNKLPQRIDFLENLYKIISLN